MATKKTAKKKYEVSGLNVRLRKADAAIIEQVRKGMEEKGLVVISAASVVRYALNVVARMK